MLHLIAAACFAVGLNAQPTAVVASGPDDPITIARATSLTRALAQRIRLDEGQYVRLRALNLHMLDERQALEISLSGAERAVRDQALAAAQQRYEAALGALLRPAQLVSYQSLRNSFTAHQL